MSSLHLASPAEWEQGNGFRNSALSSLAPGSAGFTLLSPDQTGIDFTNHLSDAMAAENQIRLNGSGVSDTIPRLAKAIGRDLPAALIEDGVVKTLNIEGPGKFEVSDADTMLKQLG
jgi:hypothetical protein